MQSGVVVNRGVRRRAGSGLPRALHWLGAFALLALLLLPSSSVQAQSPLRDDVWDLDNPAQGFVNVDTETIWRRVVGDNEYEMGVKVPFGGSFIHSSSAYRTYVVEAELRPSVGKDMDAGLIYDHDEGQNWSTFELHFESRTFKIMRHTETNSIEVWNTLLRETFTEAIRPVPERNTLRIERSATGYQFFINGVSVAQSANNTPEPAYLGIFVETEADAPGAAIFSMVRTSREEPAPAQQPAPSVAPPAPSAPAAPPAPAQPAPPPVAPPTPAPSALPPGWPADWPALR
jgi:hypothetical protein